MKKTILFIHTIANTPYKHDFYNALQEEFDIQVIQLATFSDIRQWSGLDNKNYKEFIINYSNIDYRNKTLSTWRIIKIIHKVKPEIIISHGYNRIEFLAIPFLFRNIKTGCEISTTQIDKKRSFLKETMKSITLKILFGNFFTYGTAAKNYLHKNLKISEDKIFIRGNYSHLQKYSIPISKFENRTNRILYVGRLSSEKNLQGVIEAFIGFKKKTVSNFILTLVGSGPMEEELKLLVKNAELDSAIQFINYKEPIDLIPIYQDSKLFVLASFSETWGLVVNEAMHFGLPIAISENCGCVIDLCNESNSRKFNPYQMQELTNIFTDLLVNQKELPKMSKESLEIISNHTPEKIFSNLKRIFEKVLS